MNPNERYFRHIVTAIGGTLVLFLTFLWLFQIGIGLLYEVLSQLLFSPIARDVAYSLCYCVGYLASFILPVLLLKLLIQRRGFAYRPMRVRLNVSALWLLAVPACIAIVFAASHVNAALTDIFTPFPSAEDLLGGDVTPAPALHKVVLSFMTVCVVPGFCEEFLFRGAVLENLLPFGRTNAILISALLFALAHQTPSQVFYAFAAGIVLGLVYERTRSILPVTLMHIFNNLASVLLDLISHRAPTDAKSGLYLLVFELTMLFVGVLSIALLIRRFGMWEKSFEDGVFGVGDESVDAEAACPITRGTAIRTFWQPLMLIFIVFCAVQILTTMFLNGSALR